MKSISNWLISRVYSGRKYSGFPRYWSDLPGVERHINQKITGSEEPFFVWFPRKFSPLPLASALSVGCGFGIVERQILAHQLVQKLDCIDISPLAIAQAQEYLSGWPELSRAIDFQATSFEKLPVAEAFYDMVIFWSSLHHFPDPRQTLQKAAQFLKPGGLCLINEFIGATRFQWPAPQLDLVNGALKFIPRGLCKIQNRDWPKLLYYLITGQAQYSFSQHCFYKRKVARPLRTIMWLRDPSEAVCSGMLETTIAATPDFKILERLPYGGCLLHLLLSDICGNFLRPEANSTLELLIAMEQYLLEQKILPDDFCLYLLQKP